MIGYRDPEHEWGGKFAARFDTVLNWIPARMGGFFVVVGAAMAGANARNALRVMLSQRRRTQSANAGWTMAAMAGALEASLEKRGNYVLDGGAATLDAAAIGRGLRVLRCAIALVIAFFLAACGGLCALRA